MCKAAAGNYTTAKHFKKNVLMLISGLFDPETKGNPGLVGYSLTNIDFGFS